MFCTRCGKMLEDGEECPCKQNGIEGVNPEQPWGFDSRTTSYDSHGFEHREHGYPYGKPNGLKVENIALGAVACVAILMLAGFSIIALSNMHQDNVDLYSFDVPLSGGTAYLSEDFKSNVLTYDVRDEGIFAMVNLDVTDVASYSWVVYDLNHSKYDLEAAVGILIPYWGERMATSGPELNMSDLGVGEYRIEAMYDSITPGKGLVSIISGNYKYNSHMEREFSWVYEGEDYSVKLGFEYNEYAKYSDMDVRRQLFSNYSFSRALPNFISMDEPILLDLASQLKALYAEGHTDQELANFVSDFVQCCIKYPPYGNGISGDMYQYGQDEYFAHPVETLFHGYGDCEDTSFLTANLLQLLGFDSAVVLIPTHAMAAVALGDGYSPTTYHSNQKVLTFKHDGKTYFLIETTAEAISMAIGIVASSGSVVEETENYRGYDARGSGSNGYYILSEHVRVTSS